MAKKQTKARPVHEVRLGRIRGAVWENDTQNGTRHNVTLSRLYMEGDEWKDSTSFGRDDLPLVAKVADMAHSWIFEHAAAGNGSEDGEVTSRECGQRRGTLSVCPEVLCRFAPPEPPATTDHRKRIPCTSKLG